MINNLGTFSTSLNLIGASFFKEYYIKPSGVSCAVKNFDSLDNF
jgi:hypothetical protein